MVVKFKFAWKAVNFFITKATNPLPPQELLHAVS